MAPAVGGIRVKTYLMAVPFIKSIHHINIMHAASKWIFNSKLSVTIPRGTGRECCWSEMSQPSSLKKKLGGVRPCLWGCKWHRAAIYSFKPCHAEQAWGFSGLTLEGKCYWKVMIALAKKSIR